MVNKNRNVITINLQGDIGEIFRDRELFIYQYDDGQELYFPDYEELGISEVQFANENSGEAIRREMTDGYVQIPYALLSQNRPIFAYVMCITSDSTTTMIKLIIQNNCRVIAEDAIDPEDEQTFREWVQEQIDGKQDALIAGENITIEGNVISATGGGRVNVLDDLADVDVAGATDGQTLQYNATSRKWENADGGGGETVDTQMSDSSTNAVQNRVIKAYVDGHTVDAYTKAQTDALLGAKQNALTAGTGISIVNDVISATGGGGGVDELSELTDVNISSPINKQTLKYDSISRKWENVTDDLTGLSDVTLNSPSNNQVLVYNGLLRKWVNGTAPSGVSNLANLNDVDVTGVTNGQIIKWNATSQKWESADEQATDLSNIPHLYTAYYLEQTSQQISIVITELDDDTVVPIEGDLIALRTISSDVFSSTRPTSVKMYASDEETLLATKPLQIKEQFMPNTDYLLYFYGSSLCSLTDNVNSIAQVNALIDAKINALGFAEEEEY